MKNPATLLPDAMKALIGGVIPAINGAGLPPKLLALVHMRVSQINGCGFCLQLETRHAKDETMDRLLTVAGWRDAPYFTDQERAALALAESVTRIADRGDVPDDVWADAAKHFDDKGLAALLMQISLVNVWNRLNVATRQVAGSQSW